MKRTITCINRKDSTMNAYVLAFGAYGSTHLLVYAHHFEDALDECIDWFAENLPGFLCNDMVCAEYDRAIKQGYSEEEAQEIAVMDTTCGGNCGDYILSYEWTIALDSASPHEIAAYAHGR